MKKCLIVDDASVIRKVADAILSDMNYSVIEAADTKEAATLIQTQQPDVVILDWHIPDCEPLEFLATLRSSLTGRRPYVFYCTTEKDPDIIARALDCGADDILLKPFDRAALVNKFAENKLAA